MATLVKCAKIEAGLLPSDRTVEIRSWKGVPEFFRIAADSILQENGEDYVEAGLVTFHEETGTCLIEFPTEADSGTHRVWVKRGDVIMNAAVGAVK